MNCAICVAALCASLLTAKAYVIHADVGTSSKSGEIQLQQGNQFLTWAAIWTRSTPSRKPSASVVPADLMAARTGLVIGRVAMRRV